MRIHNLIWNHTNLIINWNKKDYDSTYVDPNHTNSNQSIPDDLTNIGSINDSEHICEIYKILTSPVHSPIHASQIFNYGSASDPPSPKHE